MAFRREGFVARVFLCLLLLLVVTSGMRHASDLSEDASLGAASQQDARKPRSDNLPALVSQTVKGTFVTHDWAAGNDNSKNKSGTMALYINADLGNIRLDYAREVPYFLRDQKTEMTREETSYLVSGKKIYGFDRTYYSNGTKDDVFQWEHSTTTKYGCSVAELPGRIIYIPKGLKKMECVREQFSKRWFRDEYELKDFYKLPPATGPDAMANILHLFVKSNYGIHVSDDGGITGMDMSVQDKALAVAPLSEISGSWKTAYVLGNPEVTKFDAPVYKPDKAPSGGYINPDCHETDPVDQLFKGWKIPLAIGKSFVECLAKR